MSLISKVESEKATHASKNCVNPAKMHHTEGEIPGFPGQCCTQASRQPLLFVPLIPVSSLNIYVLHKKLKMLTMKKETKLRLALLASSSEKQHWTHRGKIDSIFKECPCLTLLSATEPVHFGPRAALGTPNSCAQVFSFCFCLFLSP